MAVIKFKTVKTTSFQVYLDDISSTSTTRYCHFYYGTSSSITTSTGTYVGTSVTMNAGSTSTSAVTISNLNANTTYYVIAQVKNGDGSVSANLSATGCTTAIGSTAPATLSVGTVTQNSIQIKLTNLKPSTYKGDSRIVHWWKNGTDVNNNTTLSNSATSTSYTFTGLTAGTSYTLGYSINANNWYTGSSKFTISASTEAPLPVEIQYISKTRNSITVKLINLDKEYTGTRTVVWKYKTTSESSYANAFTSTTFTIASRTDTSEEFTIGDLSTYTSYNIRAVITAGSTTKTVDYSGSIKTTNTNATITFSNITNSSFDYKITDISTYYSYSGYAHLTYGSSGDSNNVVPSNGTIGPITISGLSNGTSYTTELVIKKANSGKADNNTVLLRQSSDTVTTLDATLSIVKTFQNALEVKITQLDENSNLVGRYVKWYYGTTSSTSTTAYDGTALTLGVGVSEGGNFTIGNLNANTTYYIKAEVYNSAGTPIKTIPKSGSTFTQKTATASATISCTSQKQSSLTFSAANLNTYPDYTRYVHWYYKTGSNSEAESTPSDALASNSNSVSGHKISGLTANTSYTVRITVTKANSGKPDNGAILVKTSGTFSTSSGATIVANASGAFSIYAQLTNLDEEYTSNDRQIKWRCYKGNTLIGESGYYSFNGGLASTLSYGIRGLAQNTTYTIKAIVKGSGWTGTESDYPAATVTTGSDNGFTLTPAESNACSNHGATSTFTVARWNLLVDKVSEVIGGKGWSWISNNSNQGATLSVADTKASSSDKKLYASMFNSLRYNIGSHYSTGINTVQTGQIVYGAYFIGGTVNGNTVTGLVPALNNLINSDEQIYFTAPS